MSGQPAPSEPESILVVCTANLCRSPYVERLLRRELDRCGLSSIGVVSRGVRAPGGATIAPAMADIMAGEGLDVTAFTARTMTREDVAAASVVLTADRGHRGAVARLVPSSLGRVFTLRQFARLVPFASLEHLAPTTAPVAAVALAVARVRGVVTGSAGPLDDIADPWGALRTDYVEAAEAMRNAAVAITAAFAMVADSSDPSRQQQENALPNSAPAAHEM